jgi:hypothetical protein
VRVARFHDVFGPEGPWRRGREKAPALLCRKVAEAPDGATSKSGAMGGTLDRILTWTIASFGMGAWRQSA